MRRKTEMKKHILQFSVRRIIVIVIFLLCAVIFLTQCSKEDAPEVTIAISETLTPSITTDTTTVPDSLPPFIETQPDGKISGTPIPIETPKPTTTPIESLKAIDAIAQDMITPYMSNANDCREAIQNGKMERCVVLNFVQNISKEPWEQLFPDTDFFLASFYAYGNPDSDISDRSWTDLVAWQNDRYYRAENFDGLLSMGNISVNDKNRELIAKAFALMTLPSEYLQHEIVFTNWEAVDIQGVFHYNYTLQAWTELGGVEVTWGFVFNEKRLQAISGGLVQNENTGDYIDYIELGSGITRRDYDFRGE